jgi:hypothetical protein
MSDYQRVWAEWPPSVYISREYYNTFYMVDTETDGGPLSLILTSEQFEVLHQRVSAVWRQTTRN